MAGVIQTVLSRKTSRAVCDLFRRNAFLAVTIRQLALRLRKPYPKVHQAVQELVASGVLAIETVGASRVCRLRLSPEAVSVLSFLDEQEALAAKIPHVRRILEFPEFRDDIIIVAGSYAAGTAKNRSDVDVFIITAGNVAAKQRLLENKTALMRPPVHPVVVSRRDFGRMLQGTEDNYGKEVFRKRLVYRNAAAYYEIVKEAIANGFSGQAVSVQGRR